MLRVDCILCDAKVPLWTPKLPLCPFFHPLLSHRLLMSRLCYYRNFCTLVLSAATLSLFLSLHLRNVFLFPCIPLTRCRAFPSRIALSGVTS